MKLTKKEFVAHFRQLKKEGVDRVEAEESLNIDTDQDYDFDDIKEALNEVYDNNKGE